MVSISISLRRDSMSLSISSLPSNYSYDYIPPSTSHEHLVPQKSKHIHHQSHRYSTSAIPNRRPRHTPPQISYLHLQAARLRSRKMSSHPVEIEQKKSYGIGGAGNIRRPSEVIYGPRVHPDGRRRSSVWSISPGSSPEGKRNAVMNFFSRKGSVSEAPVGKETKMEFREVELGGKKER